MILMPTETNRKKLLEYVEGFKSILDMFETDAPKALQKRVILRNAYLDLMDKTNVYLGDNKSKKWLDKKLPQVITTLRILPFFKRFSLKRIVEITE